MMELEINDPRRHETRREKQMKKTLNARRNTDYVAQLQRRNFENREKQEIRAEDAFFPSMDRLPAYPSPKSPATGNGTLTLLSEEEVEDETSGISSTSCGCSSASESASRELSASFTAGRRGLSLREAPDPETVAKEDRELRLREIYLQRGIEFPTHLLGGAPLVPQNKSAISTTSSTSASVQHFTLEDEEEEEEDSEKAEDAEPSPTAQTSAHIGDGEQVQQAANEAEDNDTTKINENKPKNANGGSMVPPDACSRSSSYIECNSDDLLELNTPSCSSSSTARTAKTAQLEDRQAEGREIVLGNSSSASWGTSTTSTTGKLQAETTSAGGSTAASSTTASLASSSSSTPIEEQKRKEVEPGDDVLVTRLNNGLTSNAASSTSSSSTSISPSSSSSKISHTADRGTTLNQQPNRQKNSGPHHYPPSTTCASSSSSSSTPSLQSASATTLDHVLGNNRSSRCPGSATNDVCDPSPMSESGVGGGSHFTSPASSYKTPVSIQASPAHHEVGTAPDAEVEVINNDEQRGSPKQGEKLKLDEGVTVDVEDSGVVMGAGVQMISGGKKKKPGHQSYKCTTSSSVKGPPGVTLFEETHRLPSIEEDPWWTKP
ncbi:unnamed protein product [Amoebophrya sp. A25]|nr:unnamed protein product [Amoebophrya sp. A25]|eukprot:GSA25T00019209001.1